MVYITEGGEGISKVLFRQLFLRETMSIKKPAKIH